jgi:hypothetical protein
VALPSELRDLREAAVGGIGGLLWAAREPAARRHLRASLEHVARGEPSLKNVGLGVAREGPRFRLRAYSSPVSDELRALLDDVTSDGEGSDALKTYLAKMTPTQRIQRTTPAVEELIAVLGSDAAAAFLAGSGIFLLEYMRFWVPFLSAPARRRVFNEATRVQREVGDETSIVALFLCAPWMNIAEAAQAFACFFNVFGPLDPMNNLHRLIRRYGDIYWSAPLLRKLGGDEALVATGQEIVAAVRRAEQLAKSGDRRESG